jgi:hypothetical protein
MLAYLLLGLGSDGTEPFDRKLGSAPRCLRVSVAISAAGAARQAPRKLILKPAQSLGDRLHRCLVFVVARDSEDPSRVQARFVVTVKALGALTHAKRLYGPEAWLAHIGQGLDRLGPKRGVLLVQLPPSAAFDHPRLALFP